MNDTAGSAGRGLAAVRGPDRRHAPEGRGPQGQAPPAPAAGSLRDALSRPGSAALVALLIAAIATLVVPIAVRRMIDFGFDAEHIGLIDQYFAVMIARGRRARAGASASRYYLVTTLGERVVADMRSAVFGHLIALSAPFFDTARTGELTSRLTADTTQIKSAVGSSVSVALRNLVLFFGSATMMVITSPKLSAFVLAAIPLIVLPLVGFGRAVRRRSRAAQDTLADASAYASELIGAVRTLQAFTNEPLAAARFSRSGRARLSRRDRSTRARAILTAIIIFLASASVVVILWVGAQDVIAGEMTPGRLSQFVLFAVFAASGLGQLSEVWGELSQAAGSAERLMELLAIEPEIRAPAHPVPLPQRPRAEVAFENVRFAYPARPETDVLDGVSFRVKPGEKVAIVGPSGAGKSTIFHLILRFYDPKSGTVTFDGVRLPDADPAELRRHIALVPQDTAIFGMSVRDNIRFGRPDATDAEIERAAEDAAAACSSARCRKATTRRSASAASRCRAASASASPSRARSCARRRCSCSTKRPRRSTPRARRWCRRR